MQRALVHKKLNGCTANQNLSEITYFEHLFLPHKKNQLCHNCNIIEVLCLSCMLLQIQKKIMRPTHTVSGRIRPVASATKPCLPTSDEWWYYNLKQHSGMEKKSLIIDTQLNALNCIYFLNQHTFSMKLMGVWGVMGPGLCLKIINK